MLMDIDFDEQPSDLAATSARAGAKFKPKARPRLRKHVSVSTSPTLSNNANEMLSTQVASENLTSLFSDPLLSEIHVPDNDIINQSTHGTLSEENVEVISGDVHCCVEPTHLHAHTDMDSEKQRCHMPTLPGDPRTQHLETLGGFVVASELDEDIDAQTKSIQPEEEEGRLDWESVKIVQEVTSGYGKDTLKFQSKPRFHSNVIEGQNYGVNEEEPSEPHYSADDIGHISTDSTGAFNTNADSYASGAAEKEPKNSEEPNQCSENPQKKKHFKHSTPRPKRTLEKELLEIPDDEIRFLPIRDLLRLVDYKEWLEKREAKRGKGSQSQESTSKAHDNQYTQDDTENFESDEYRENQESSRVKPDSPVNYQTYMHKTPRSRWSKQDTELFYEGICEFGSNLSMVQQLFPNRSRQQLKLKYKMEERKHPMKLNDALTSRSKHHIHYQNVIKKLQQEAAARKAEEEEEEEEAGATEATEAETNDVPDNSIYEETETAGGTQVEAENSLRSDGAKAENDQRSDGGDDDADDNDEAECDYWASYKSDM